MYLGDNYVGTDTHQAIYEAPISVATLSVSPTTMSTQVTEENAKITIETEVNSNSNETGWKNGTFLVKLPAEIIYAEINSVEIDNYNNVEITSYETYEQDGNIFIKRCRFNTRPKNLNNNIRSNIICSK